MRFLQKFLLIVSLLEIFYIVSLESAVWRTVSNAVLSCSGFSPDSSITNLSKCNDTCLSKGKSCLSYSFSSKSGCMIYDTRFGFGNCQLEINNDYAYYEKPIDIDDNYGDILNKSQSVNGQTSFLSRYREGITGYVSYIPGTDTLVVKSTDSAEECAKYCTRRRGVIDSTTGVRCDSFHYQQNTKTCHLTSISLDALHDINLGDGSWKYYDRLKGDGCWITQSACQHGNGTKYIGNFKVNVSYEYECVAEAEYYHEDVCNNLASVPTVAVWGGDGAAVFDAWNSWDDSTGCVIDFGTLNCNSGSRFQGKFRDSIGEDQYAAWFKADYCFDRATSWYSYCGFSDTEQINISFPDTSSYKIYPVSSCKCDSHGKKIDIASNRPYCTRNSSSICWRSVFQDYWSYPDILCDDAACPEFTSNNKSKTYCYLQEFTCHNSYINASFYYEIPCSNLTGSVCNFDEKQCLAMAEYYHTKCHNSDTDNQAVVFYEPTGAMSTYPSDALPAQTSLIRGLYGDASYTVYNSSSISLISISDGRWMAFTAIKSGNVRQITIFWYSTQTVTLTLDFYEGTGTTGNALLATSTATFSPSTSSYGDYIHFPIDSVYVTTGSTYTWQVTSSSSSNTAGYVGYIPGNLYGNGGGDLTFDYIFVEWVEYYNQAPQTLISAVSLPKNGRPWFEKWFIIGLVLFFLFAIFLLFLTYRRKQNEKKAEAEERKLQAEVKRRARLQMDATKGNDADQAGDQYVALNGGDNSANNSGNDQKHVNASSIIEEDPNINSNEINNDDDNDNDDNNDDDQ